MSFPQNTNKKVFTESSHFKKKSEKNNSMWAQAVELQKGQKKKKPKQKQQQQQQQHNRPMTYEVIDF